MRILENKNNFTILKDNINNIIFFSYNQQIATFDKYNNKLYINNLWNYSQTTLKQFKNFINEYTTFIYNNKKDFEIEIKNNKDIILM